MLTRKLPVTVIVLGFVQDSVCSVHTTLTAERVKRRNIRSLFLGEFEMGTVIRQNPFLCQLSSIPVNTYFPGDEFTSLHGISEC